MAVVTIEANDGTSIARVTITNAHGPWTDGDLIDWIAKDINAALEYEEDYA